MKAFNQAYKNFIVARATGFGGPSVTRVSTTFYKLRKS